MKLAYYAHCMSIYDTYQEDRDVDLLKSLGFEVSNPNCAQVELAVTFLRREDKQLVMEIVFKPLVLSADVFAFRALPDGSISSGVYRELVWAQEDHVPIIELPTSLKRRELSLELTREYLREVGQR